MSHGIYTIMQRKLTCSKRTEEAEEESPDGVPGPTMVWLFNSSFAYMIYCVFLKQKHKTHLFASPFRIGFMSLVTKFSI